MADELAYTELSYGSHTLQKVGVWRFTSDQVQSSGDHAKYWLVFIHGGGWRDPRDDFTKIVPGINKLLTGAGDAQHPLPNAASRVAGFASINYRLGPHPRFKQDETKTPPDELRVAKHPDHINDVLAALALLQREFGFGGPDAPYILYGHSVGATLSFQTVTYEKDESIKLPVAIIGFEGLYDFVSLNNRVDGLYTEMFEGPFGPEKAVWDRWSPAKYLGSYKESWGSVGKVVVIANSLDDELVDMEELKSMEDRLKQEEGLALLVYGDLHGKHDEVVDDGRYVARVLGQTIQALDA